MSASNVIAAEFVPERFRPRFHFTPERNWMNDPNGLVFFEGEYHLFYQCNPFANGWGHMSWGHAISRDLIHWEYLPVAMLEREGASIFSGSVIVDWNNTSGFGENGQPALVAIFTADRRGEHQAQWLSYSNDRGRTWTFHDGNPVLDLNLKDFRDPKVFWHPGTQQWVMVVALPTVHRISLYTSPDLKRWSHLDDFGPAGAVGGVWECPDLFPLPVEGEAGTEKWVLVVNLNPGGVAGGSGCQYFVGNFDGRQFVLDAPSPNALWADFGPDFYAAVTWSDVPAVDGRRILLGWMSNHDYAVDTPTTPWRGAMAIPRVLSLRRTSAGLRLIQQPVSELHALRRSPPRRFARGTFAQGAVWLAEQEDLPSCMDIEITLSQMDAKADFRVALHTGPEEFTSLDYCATTGELSVDRRASGLTTFHKGFGGKYCAPLRLRDARCTLRLLCDVSSLEVFACDGETVFTSLIFPTGNKRFLRMTAGENNHSSDVEILIFS